MCIAPRPPQSEIPKSEARNPKQYQNFKLLMFKTRNKHYGISRKDENFCPLRQTGWCFCFAFWLLEIVSNFGFRVSNLFILGGLGSAKG